MRTTSTLIAVVLGLTSCKKPGDQRAHVARTASAVSDVFVTAKPKPSPADAAPWSLTASDGSGLVLSRVEGKAVVEGPLAFTELHLYFHNPEDRTREGTFEITLPAGAAVSRFAMEINGQMMEAEVVEKQRARRAYEDFLHKRQDPALLEKAAGNQFSARVFPIAAKGDKHLVISFSQEVTPGQYGLKLRGLATTKQIDLGVKVRTRAGAFVEQKLTQTDWKPDRDFEVDLSATGVPVTVTAGDLIATRVKVEVPDAAQPPTGITLLVDTSASRAAGFASEARRVQALVDELARKFGAALPIQIVAYDQTSEQLYAGTAGAATGIDTALLRRGALGASDFGQALKWIGAHGAKPRVIVVTDGVITAGAELEELRTTARGLGQQAIDRIDLVLSGGIRDEQAAAAISQAGLPHVGVVVDLDRGAPEVARRIGLGVSTNIPVTAPDASWVFPTTIAAAQSGDEVTIYMRRAPNAKAVAVVLGPRSNDLAPVSIPPMLISRAIASAEITELDAQLAKQSGDEAAKTRAEIVKRSLAARVVSSQTSLLVLETENDYVRFGIERTALADILTIGPDGVTLLGRKQLPVIIASNVEPTKRRGDDDQSKTDEGPPPPGTAWAPPPEEADRPDDGAEESGGTGTAMALEEGRMGKPDSERAEGQYRMQRNAATAEPQVARPLSVSNSRAHDEPENQTPALTGPLAEVTEKIANGKIDAALHQAATWRLEQPGDVLALIALGDALEAKNDLATAARAYGSIIDLYPGRADFRRFAGERLERLGDAQRALVIDTYRRAVAERPDHMTGHRLLAYALVRGNKLAEAFAAILVGLDREYPGGRFRAGKRVLVEDAGMIGAVYVAADSTRRGEVVAALTQRQATLATQPSTRFIMYWETDGNDVDFHIRDANGGHAYYSAPELPSGGELYGDITDGYGPECFAINGPAKAGPYRLSINYYSQGPMGYGMGLLQIQTFDGKGKLTFDDRPYVIMMNQAFVNLGSHK